MHAVLRRAVWNKPYNLYKGYNDNHPVYCLCFINYNRNYEKSRFYSTKPYSHRKINLFLNSIENRHYLGNVIVTNVISRNFSISQIRLSDKPSSQIEKTVQNLNTCANECPPVKPKKKSIGQKIKDELNHYYHGFRLLFIDVKVSTILIFRVLNGHTLTRREYRLLTRTVGDMFRLVPFSAFIVVPFLEFTLPIFLKFFPGMLPSTFQTAKEKEDKIKQSLKVKLEMAKFLQETLDNMAVQNQNRQSDKAKEFSEWFHKVRTSGQLVTNEEIMKFSKLFEDEITLDSLSRSQLIALCRVLEIQTLGTNNLLRFQLRMKLRSLAADDRWIKKEGIDSLNLAELQQACRVRGMRAYGVSEERLKAQLSQWLDLSLNEKVPPSLLLLSRALMLPETIPTSDKLKATISVLPPVIEAQTKVAICISEGKVDNKATIELIKEEERKIKEERLEILEMQKREQQKKKEELIDKAPIITTASTPILEDQAIKISAAKLEKVEKKDEELTVKDLEIIENAIDEVSKKENRLILEKGELKELKEEMAEYKEDVEELGKVVAQLPKPEIKESKAAKRLFKSVNKMIAKLDVVMENLEKKEKQLKEIIEAEKPDDTTKEELLKIDDILLAIKQIKGARDDVKIEKIENVLQKMDIDSDGAIKVEDVLKVIEILGKDYVNLSNKQVDEIIDLLNKEQVLEVQDKIEKTLQKDKETTSPQPQAKSIIQPPVVDADQIVPPPTKGALPSSIDSQKTKSKTL